MAKGQMLPLETKLVRVSRAHWIELDLLRKSWKKSTFDQVVEELLRPHQLEKLRLMGIQLPREETDEIRS